jgi:penicillin-binding protein 1A
MTSPPPRQGRWRLLVPALAALAAGGVVAVGQTLLVRGLDSLLPDSGRINSFNLGRSRSSPPTARCC